MLSTLPFGGLRTLLITLRLACVDAGQIARPISFVPMARSLRVWPTLECASVPASVLLSRLAYTWCPSLFAPTMPHASETMERAVNSRAAAHSTRILNRSPFARTANLRRLHCLKQVLLVRSSVTILSPTGELELGFAPFTSVLCRCVNPFTTNWFVPSLPLAQTPVLRRRPAPPPRCSIFDILNEFNPTGLLGTVPRGDPPPVAPDIARRGVTQRAGSAHARATRAGWMRLWGGSVPEERRRQSSASLQPEADISP